MILAEGMERRKLLHAVYEVFSPNDGSRTTLHNYIDLHKNPKFKNSSLYNSQLI